MNIKNELSSFKKRLIESFEIEGKKSYSQFGEDIIVASIFYLLKKPKIQYLDIGANFPKHFSNTYYFYKKGSRGVCIEPDSELFNYYIKIRPNDRVFNIGIGENELDEIKDLFFYKGERKGLNTFSPEKLVENQKLNSMKADKVKVKVRNINKIIEENFKSPPDFLSIDIEGLDLDVLKTLNFKKNGPTVICCELTRTDENNFIVENTDLKNLLVANNYFQYANTFINGIFIQKSFEREIFLINNWY